MRKKSAVACIGLPSVFFASFIFVCSVRPAEAADPRALLIQKKMEPPEGTAPVSFETGQVEIVFPDGRTKILPYRSYFEPLVVKDRVFILTTKDGELTGIVVHDTKSGRSQSHPRPGYLNPYFSCPSFSPDGTKLAHYELARESQGRVLVRFWPTGKILQQSPLYPLLPTDVPPLQPTWKTPFTVEFDPNFFSPSRVLFFEFKKE